MQSVDRKLLVVLVEQEKQALHINCEGFGTTKRHTPQLPLDPAIVAPGACMTELCKHCQLGIWSEGSPRRTTPR